MSGQGMEEKWGIYPLSCSVLIILGFQNGVIGKKKKDI